MRVSAKVMATVVALLWGGCLLFVGLINMGAPSYGADFLRMMSSVYPGFHDTRTWGEVIAGHGLRAGGRRHRWPAIRMAVQLGRALEHA